LASTIGNNNNEQPVQDVQLTPFFAGITLDVTPQIDQTGGVTLHVHPAISTVEDQEKRLQINGNDTQLPLALSTIRESDTVVHARNGEVVVIGGLSRNESQEDVAQLPFFGNIPFLGSLGRNTKQGRTRNELVILIRPIVVGDKTWYHHMDKTRQQFRQVERGFHFGGRPDLFGTEGEQPVLRQQLEYRPHQSSNRRG